MFTFFPSILWQPSLIFKMATIFSEIRQYLSFVQWSNYSKISGGGPFPSLPSPPLPLPSLFLPLPSLPSPPFTPPPFAARGSGGALKPPQRVRAEPGRQTFSGAFRAINPASDVHITVTRFPILRC